MKVIAPGREEDKSDATWEGMDLVHLSCGAKLHIDEADLSYQSTVNGQQRRGFSLVFRCGWCHLEETLRLTQYAKVPRAVIKRVERGMIGMGMVTRLPGETI